MKAGIVRSASLLTLLAGCSGNLISPLGPSGNSVETVNDGNGPGSAGGGGVGPTSFVCDNEAPGVAQPLRRLSRAQYENSVQSLLQAALPATEANAVWREVASTFKSVPTDVVNEHAPFASMDQAVSQQHVDAYFRAGEATARALTSSSARIEALLACDASSSESACVDAFIRRFARRAYRHEPSADALAFLREVYDAEGIDAEGLRDVITVVLNAPEFLYHIEGSGEAIAGKPDTYALDDYELAARVAFQFWQTLPDDTLLDAAEKGELRTEEGFTRAVEHALSSARARDGFATFVREWFAIDSLRALDQLVGDPVFDALVGDDVPSPDLRDDMIAEVLDSFEYHASRDDSFLDWFQSPYSFAKSAELAHIYGVGVWDGVSEPPRFPEGQRAGLITRAALLATGTANTRPIIKGVFLRERILCDEIAAPPANAANMPPELSPTLTTREVVEALTEQKGSSCAGCHAYQINGLGFPTENYDPLGRIRQEQRLFNEKGELMASKPVNTVAIPRVTLRDETPVEGAIELAERIAESGKAEACFARQYARYALARSEDLAKDGCLLESVRSALKEGQGLKSAMRSFALRPEFRQRFIGEAK